MITTYTNSDLSRIVIIKFLYPVLLLAMYTIIFSMHIQAISFATTTRVEYAYYAYSRSISIVQRLVLYTRTQNSPINQHVCMILARVRARM